VEIRRARPDDAAAIAALRVRAWRAAYRGILPDASLDALDAEADAPRWRGYLEAAAPDDRLWLAVDGDELVGYARTGASADDDVDLGTAEVHGLYVAPELIGSGVGRTLLAHALDDLAARGHEAVVLWHFVGNERAARFYERAGLRPDGARRPSRHGADEVRLRRPLDRRDRH
jgi:ribosomal protein S18 acetylase RimI-like enzyme